MKKFLIGILVLMIFSTLSFGAYPSNLVGYTPITLHNSQSNATNESLQIPIYLNLSQLTHGKYNKNLANFEFFYTNNTILSNSWIESNSSSNVLVWVKLKPSIPANSNIIINLGYASNTTNLLGTNIGEAPQLSSTYAEYDNGANVFTFYNNLNSATGWTSAGTISSSSFGSGLSITTGTAWGGYYYNGNMISASDYLEAYGSSTTAGNGAIGTCLGELGFTSSATYALYGAVGCGAGNNASGEAGGTYTGADQILTLLALSGTHTLWVNYVLTLTDNVVGQGASGDIQIEGYSSTIKFYWIRTRTPPPSNIQPSTTFGSFVSINSSPTPPPSNNSYKPSFVSLSGNLNYTQIIKYIDPSNSLNTQLYKIPANYTMIKLNLSNYGNPTNWILNYTNDSNNFSLNWYSFQRIGNFQYILIQKPNRTQSNIILEYNINKTNQQIPQCQIIYLFNNVCNLGALNILNNSFGNSINISLINSNVILSLKNQLNDKIILDISSNVLNQSSIYNNFSLNYFPSFFSHDSINFTTNSYELKQFGTLKPFVSFHLAPINTSVDNIIFDNSSMVFLNYQAYVSNSPQIIFDGGYINETSHLIGNFTNSTTTLTNLNTGTQNIQIKVPQNSIRYINLIPYFGFSNLTASQPKNITYSNTSQCNTSILSQFQFYKSISDINFTKEIHLDNVNYSYTHNYPTNIIKITIPHYQEIGNTCSNIGFWATSDNTIIGKIPFDILNCNSTSTNATFMLLNKTNNGNTYSTARIYMSNPNFVIFNVNPLENTSIYNDYFYQNISKNSHLNISATPSDLSLTFSQIPQTNSIVVSNINYIFTNSQQSFYQDRVGTSYSPRVINQQFTTKQFIITNEYISSLPFDNVSFGITTYNTGDCSLDASVFNSIINAGGGGSFGYSCNLYSGNFTSAFYPIITTFNYTATLYHFYSTNAIISSQVYINTFNNCTKSTNATFPNLPNPTLTNSSQSPAYNNTITNKLTNASFNSSVANFINSNSQNYLLFGEFSLPEYALIFLMIFGILITAFLMRDHTAYLPLIALWIIGAFGYIELLIVGVIILLIIISIHFTSKKDELDG